VTIRLCGRGLGGLARALSFLGIMQTNFPKLRPAGITATGTADEIAPPWQLAVSSSDSLQRLSEEYAFYTPALLYLYVKLNRDPLYGFFAEHPDVKQFQLKFDKPIFDGLVGEGPSGARTDWNHWLYAVERKHWPDFAGYLGSLAVYDRANNLFVRLRPREVRIVDPVWMAKQAVVGNSFPTVPVTAWCLDTNRGCVWLEGAGDPAAAAGDPAKVFGPRDVASPGDAAEEPTKASDIRLLKTRPTVVRTKSILPETLVFADAILKQSTNPYGILEQFQRTIDENCV